jgi:photoactive yellow protein
MQRPVCLWGGEELTEEESARGNLCSRCWQVATGIPGLSSEALDSLPFGVIELNRSGEVIKFNCAEETLSGRSRNDVIGRNFFSEIAPCSDVKEFRGRFEEFLDTSKRAAQFDFVYYFDTGTVAVMITFFRINQELALVLSTRVNK